MAEMKSTSTLVSTSSNLPTSHLIGAVLPIVVIVDRHRLRASRNFLYKDPLLRI